MISISLFTAPSAWYLKPARMVADDSHGILIGDGENEKVSGRFAEILSQYQQPEPSTNLEGS